jgi:hypothetical protein
VDNLSKTPLEQRAAADHFSYFSSIKVLCNEEGCLTREGRNFQKPFSMDLGHLTPIASKLMATKLAPYMVGAAERRTDQSS